MFAIVLQHCPPDLVQRLKSKDRYANELCTPKKQGVSKAMEIVDNVDAEEETNDNDDTVAAKAPPTQVKDSNNTRTPAIKYHGIKTRKIPHANKYFQNKILPAHKSKLPTNQGERGGYRKGKEPSMFGYMTARPGRLTKSTQSTPITTPPLTNTSNIVSSAAIKKKGNTRGLYTSYKSGIIKEVLDAEVKLLLLSRGGGVKRRHVQTWQWYPE